MICFISSSRDSSIAIRKRLLKTDIFSYQRCFPNLENLHGVEDFVNDIPFEFSIALIDSVSDGNFGDLICEELRELKPNMTLIVLFDKSLHKTERFKYYEKADYEIDMDRGDEPAFSLSPLLGSLGYVPEYGCRHLKLIKDTHSAIYLGMKMPLTESEYRILLFICTNADRVISPEELLAFCFSESYRMVISNVKHHISHINEKSKALGGRKLILSVRGKGYKINDFI